MAGPLHPTQTAADTTQTYRLILESKGFQQAAHSRRLQRRPMLVATSAYTHNRTKESFPFSCSRSTYFIAWCVCCLSVRQVVIPVARASTSDGRTVAWGSKQCGALLVIICEMHAQWSMRWTRVRLNTRACLELTKARATTIIPSTTGGSPGADYQGTTKASVHWLDRWASSEHTTQHDA